MGLKKNRGPKQGSRNVSSCVSLFRLEKFHKAARQFVSPARSLLTNKYWLMYVLNDITTGGYVRYSSIQQLHSGASPDCSKLRKGGVCLVIVAGNASASTRILSLLRRRS